MAFVRDLDRYTRPRFSLLLLEFGEIYYEDYSVHFFPPDCDDRALVQRPIKGRLLVCSNSLLFDPSDPVDPILKFSYRKCKKLGRWNAPLMSPITGETMMIEVKEYVRLKEGNLIKPYLFVKLDKPALFRFCPNYNPLSVLLSKSNRLFKAHNDDAKDRVHIINTITREHRDSVPFNTSWLEDLNENILMRADADRVTPMVSNPGRVVLTDSVVYFQPFNNIDPEPVQRHHLRNVSRVVRRRYLLRQVGLEIFLKDNVVVFLAFCDAGERDQFFDLIATHATNLDATENQGNVMLMWQNGQLSNYDYLMYLNRMADRSFNDLTQYPVFPWVIADYTSETLDLTNAATFRDLSKPIGALNESRLQDWKVRYDEMPPPKFLYGTHYSSPGYVLFYTVREAPEYMLCLQNGKYDNADRMFRSIADTWSGVLEGMADVKELIPEFYMPSSEFLVNKLRLDLGTTQDTQKVNDVALPPWAKNADDFLTQCREALECDYVSNHIHHWIDLIFGFKQRGPEAVTANNVFYYITYEGAVDLDRITDPMERESLQAQIMEFGQTPKQLFTIPHPARRTGVASMPASPTKTLSGASSTFDVFGGVSETGRVVSGPGGPGEDLIVGIAEIDSAAAIADDGSGAVSAEDAVEASDATAGGGSAAAGAIDAMYWGDMQSLTLNSCHKLHRDSVHGMALSPAGKTLYTVSQDGNLKVFSLDAQQQTHAVPIGDMGLSSVLPLDDGVTVVVGSWDNNVYWYNMEYGRVMNTLEAHDDAVAHLVRTSDGLLITASWDATVKVWTYDEVASSARRRGHTGGLVAELTAVDSEVRCMDVHEARGLLVAGGSFSGQTVVWTMSGFDVLHVFNGHDDAVNAVAFSPDGQRVLSAGNDHTLRIFSVDHGQQIATFDLEQELFVIRCDGQTVLGGCDDGSLLIFDTVQGRQLATKKKHTAAIKCMALTADTKTLVTGSDDHSVCIWDRAV